MPDDQVPDDDRCRVCGALSGGEIRDPDTGETVVIWWCVNCGAHKPERRP